jgi:hypothetical protein
MGVWQQIKKICDFDLGVNVKENTSKADAILDTLRHKFFFV